MEDGMFRVQSLMSDFHFQQTILCVMKAGQICFNMFTYQKSVA